MQPQCGMGGEKPLEYSEMEDLHFQKFVTEFPFLRGVIDLCYDHEANPKPTKISIERISLGLVKNEIPDNGLPMRFNSACGSFQETTCSQLFAVKSGIVGELSGGYFDRCYLPNGDGTFDYYDPYEPLLEDEDESFSNVVWPILHKLRGDESFVVMVDYRLSYDDLDDDDNPSASGWYYSRVVTIYKPPKCGTLAENIEHWQSLERDEINRAYNQWYANQEESHWSLPMD